MEAVLRRRVSVLGVARAGTTIKAAAPSAPTAALAARVRAR
jgi:hypothetical protein